LRALHDSIGSLRNTSTTAQRPQLRFDAFFKRRLYANFEHRLLRLHRLCRSPHID
jgi:hypothetical protein